MLPEISNRALQKFCFNTSASTIRMQMQAPLEYRLNARFCLLEILETRLQNQQSKSSPKSDFTLLYTTSLLTLRNAFTNVSNINVYNQPS